MRGGQARLWSRNGNDPTDKFPDVARAVAAQLQVDCVLDGELVVWTGDRLDFDALQRRMANSAATVRRKLMREEPASFVAFDVLAVDGVDIRMMRWSVRRKRLEALAKSWQPPLQLSPVTDDVDEAREWMEVFRTAGVEGLVVKGAATRYTASRGWIKYKSRETVEVIAGGVIGPLKAPKVLIAGRYRGDELVVVGRSVPLSPAPSAALGAVLRAPGPDHPWPDEIGTGRWGGKAGKVTLTKADPYGRGRGQRRRRLAGRPVATPAADGSCQGRHGPKRRRATALAEQQDRDPRRTPARTPILCSRPDLPAGRRHYVFRRVMVSRRWE
jgi:hypothetical protein